MGRKASPLVHGAIDPLAHGLGGVADVGVQSAGAAKGVLGKTWDYLSKDRAIFHPSTWFSSKGAVPAAAEGAAPAASGLMKYIPSLAGNATIAAGAGYGGYRIGDNTGELRGTGQTLKDVQTYMGQNKLKTFTGALGNLFGMKPSPQGQADMISGIGASSNRPDTYRTLLSYLQSQS